MEPLEPRERKLEAYFAGFLGPVDQKRVEEIRAAVSKQGFWEETGEWRISTEITLRVESFEGEHGRQWYRVTVRNGIDTTCECPTLSRAVHFLTLLERLTMDIFWTQGWSTWAAKGRMEPYEHEV